MSLYIYINISHNMCIYIYNYGDWGLMFIWARYTNPKSRITKQNGGGLFNQCWGSHRWFIICTRIKGLARYPIVMLKNPTKMFIQCWFIGSYIWPSYFQYIGTLGLSVGFFFRVKHGKTMLISPLRCGRWRTSCTSYGRASLQRAGFKLWYLVINLIVSP